MRQCCRGVVQAALCGPFYQQVEYSDSELAETQVWLDFAHRCGYLAEADYETLNRDCGYVSGGLVKMMSGAEQWCGPASLVREEQTLYEE